MLLLRTWAKRIEWESTREWSCPEPRGISAYRLIWQACILTLSLLHTLKAQSLRLPNGIPLALLSQTYIWFVPLDSPDKFVKLSTLPLNFFFTSTKSQCSDQRRGSHIHLFTIAIRLAASPQHPPKGAVHGLNCSTAYGIFLGQGLNPRLSHWQVDSLPLSLQGSPS